MPKHLGQNVDKGSALVGGGKAGLCHKLRAGGGLAAVGGVAAGGAYGRGGGYGQAAGGVLKGRYGGLALGLGGGEGYGAVGCNAYVHAVRVKAEIVFFKPKNAQGGVACL